MELKKIIIKIRKYVLSYTFVLLSLFAVECAFAVPADDTEDLITQPDGSTITIRQQGDEWHNRVETSDGYTIDQAADGYWFYVQGYKDSRAIFSETRAHEAPPLDLIKGNSPPFIRPEYSPDLGIKGAPSPAPNGAFTGKILFILAQFNDEAGTTTETSWASFISNNIADYFNKASYGNVTLQPASETCGISNNGVTGWVTLNYSHPNTGSSTGIANQTLTKDAIIAADSCVNYASFDSNSDGYVDSDELAVVVIAAGYERSYSPTYTPNVWGHKWSISSPPTVDGKIVGAYHSGAGGYAQFGENHGTHQATMGIMVHELGHLIFGLPDLYDTDSSSSGIGAFGIMGGGSWGRQSSDTNSGETPVLPSAWSQLERAWVTASEGSGSESITAAGASTASSANTVIKASTTNINQYFLVQNRQNLGYDQGLERWIGNSFGGGLNIWHIDDSNTSNSNDSNRWVDVEEADGTQMGTTKGENNDLWYSGNAVTFNDTSTPNSKLYDTSSNGVDINSISTPGTTMTASFGSIALPVVSSPDPADGSTVAEGGSGQLLRVTAPGATSGTIHYDDDSGINYSTPATMNGDYLEATIPYASGTMSNDGTNYWYVEVTNVAGTTRYPSSGNLSFIVTPTPVPPVVSSPDPADGSTVAEGGSGQLLRVTAPGATSGTIHYEDDSGINYSTPATMNGDYLEATIPYASGTMNYDGTNYWYVEVTNVAGTTRYPSSGNLSFIVTPAPILDQYEPDNDSGQANIIQSGVSQVHSIVPSDDEDWVMFTLTERSDLMVETNGASGDTRMWLYDGRLTEIAFDDSSGNGLFSRITMTDLAAGTYYVEIDEFGNDEEIPSYTIIANYLSSQDEDILLKILPAIISTIKQKQ